MGQLAVTTREASLAAMADAGRFDVSAVHEPICKSAPQLAPCLHGGVLGYALFQQRSAVRRESESCRISRASNAQ
jgi:hypothetical protein